MDATRVKLVGNSTLHFTREIVIFRSSRGWRNTSSTFRLNSGSSSRNKTPLCARLISPGCGKLPPPVMAVVEIVWCGSRNGRLEISPLPCPSFPATECILVVSRLSPNDSGGRMEGRRFASMDFPLPGAPTNMKLCAKNHDIIMLIYLIFATKISNISLNKQKIYIFAPVLEIM